MPGVFPLFIYLLFDVDDEANTCRCVCVCVGVVMGVLQLVQQTQEKTKKLQPYLDLCKIYSQYF
jgi:ABC-type molybdate transport system permease subunit